MQGTLESNAKGLVEANAKSEGEDAISRGAHTIRNAASEEPNQAGDPRENRFEAASKERRIDRRRGQGHSDKQLDAPSWNQSTACGRQGRQGAIDNITCAIYAARF